MELPALAPAIQLQEAMTALGGHVFYVTGTGKRMRYVAQDPFANGSLIRIAPGRKSYEIIAEQPVAPDIRTAVSPDDAQLSPFLGT